MKNPLSPSEKQNITKGRIGSSIFHVILLALLFINWFTYPDPPLGQTGVTVLEGIDQLVIINPAIGNEQPESSKPKEVQPEEEVKPIKKPIKKTSKPKTQKLKVDPNSKELPLSNSNKTKKGVANTKVDAEIAEAKKEAEAEKLRLEEEKAKKEEDERKAAEKQKRFEDLLNNGNGKTENDSKLPAGKIDGEVDGSALGNLDKGKISGNLSGRGGDGPSFKPAQQEKGKVAIKICVDESGQVISAKRTQRGTSISLSSPNVELARKAALKWKFKAGESACGVLTFNIKLK